MLFSNLFSRCAHPLSWMSNKAVQCVHIILRNGKKRQGASLNILVLNVTTMTIANSFWAKWKLECSTSSPGHLQSAGFSNCLFCEGPRGYQILKGGEIWSRGWVLEAYGGWDEAVSPTLNHDQFSDFLGINHMKSISVRIIPSTVHHTRRKYSSQQKMRSYPKICRLLYETVCQQTVQNGAPLSHERNKWQQIYCLWRWFFLFW